MDVLQMLCKNTTIDAWFDGYIRALTLEASTANGSFRVGYVYEIIGGGAISARRQAPFSKSIREVVRARKVDETVELMLYLRTHQNV